MNDIYFYLKDKLSWVYNIGVSREPDESKKKYIKLINIISLNTIFTNLFTSVLFLTLTRNSLPGIMSFIGSLTYIVPILLNARGHALGAKLYLFLFSVNLILFLSCWFSHETKLDQYYLILVTTCNFAFHPKERKARHLCLALSLFYYVIESTSLQYFLPSFNKLVDFEKTDLILLTGHILLMVLDVIAFSYINKIRESQLIDKSMQIEKNHLALQIQNEDLQTFGSMASHALQTPIHVSKYFLNVIQEKTPEQDHYNAPKKYIEIIYNSINQMGFLVEGLFFYDRIIKSEEAYTSFSVAEILSTIKVLMLEKHISAKIDIIDSDYQITTNQMLFSIIIQNLVDNGLHYNLSEQKAVKIWGADEDNFTAFFVADNGIGIEESNFSRIFKPFARLNTSKHFTGNGLGLAGAKRAAERLGGQLFCKASSVNGSIFQLNIPKTYA